MTTSPADVRTTRRLAALERAHRRLQVVVVALAAIVLLAALAQCGTAGRVVEAGSFVLYDGNGDRRAVLNMSENLATPGATETAGPTLTLFDTDGEIRAQLGVTTAGSGYVVVLDQTGTPVLQRP